MTLSNGIVWEINKETGSHADNGGGFNPASTGVDGSQGAPINIYTDLVIGSPATKLSSAGRPFVANDVGNIINITGGTGFTAGKYEIMSVSSGIAICDTSVGTASSTGGQGRLGGAVNDPARIGGWITNNNKIYVKYNASDYSMTSTLINQTAGVFELAGTNNWLLGYETTRDDDCPNNKPTFIANSPFASSYMVRVGGTGNGVFNLRVNGNSRTGVRGIELNNATTQMVLDNCNAVNCLDYGFFIGNSCVARNCLAESCSGGFLINAAGLQRCVAKLSGSPAGFMINNLNARLTQCIAIGSTGTSAGFRQSNFTSNNTFDRCVAINCSDKAWAADNGTGVGTLCVDCVEYGNLSGFSGGNSPNGMYFINCATQNSMPSGVKAKGTITLTADPFVNSGSYDLTLNNTAGGGALLKNKQFNFQGITGIDYYDINALRHQDPSAPAPVVIGRRRRMI